MATRVFTVTSQGPAYEIASRYRAAGQDLVFFIHGLGCSHKSFQHAFFCKSLEGFSLMAIDLIGFGASSKPEDFSYSMEDHAGVCSELLEQLTFGRLHVVCHSMGGAIGLLLSPRVHKKISSFSNIEGNLTADDCAFSRKTKEVSFAEFEKILLPAFKADWGCYADLDSTSPVAFYRSAKSLVEWSDSGKLLDKFARLPCRKRYFCGANDPPEQSVRELARLRFSTTVYIQDCGHFVMNENPAAFYSSLADFLNRKN